MRMWDVKEATHEAESYAFESSCDHTHQFMREKFW